MSEGQLYITNEYSFRVLYFISIFLKRKVQYRVKYEMLTLSFFYNFAYCHLLYRASRAVWMIVRFHGNFVTVLASELPKYNHLTLKQRIITLVI